MKQILIYCPEVGYHMCNERLLTKYRQTGFILPPVRFWSCKKKAKKWGAKCGRNIMLTVKPAMSYPLPDHKPGWFSPNHVKIEHVEYMEIKNVL